MPGRQFKLVITVPEDADDQGGIRRLRAFLKAMKRSFGIRCDAAEPVMRFQPQDEMAGLSATVKSTRRGLASTDTS